jgi:hypothetical protein
MRDVSSRVNTTGLFGFLFPLKAGWLFLGFHLPASLELAIAGRWKPRKQ